MSDKSSKLAERVCFHYGQQNQIVNYMDVRRADIQDFEPIQYIATVDSMIPEKDFEIDDLAQQIGVDIADREVSVFLSSLKTIACKTVKTTLDEIVGVLEQTHDELWDLGFNVEQLFMPRVLKNEIRKRKQSTGVGINFSTQSIRPILVNELGHSQIIFANKHCFGKTYPMTIDKQILVSVRTGIKNSEIDCSVIQNTHFRNLESMRKIIVIDAENSEFLNSDQ